MMCAANAATRQRGKHLQAADVILSQGDVFLPAPADVIPFTEDGFQDVHERALRGRNQLLPLRLGQLGQDGAAGVNRLLHTVVQGA